ncbi:hypothetical protein GOBAR_DD27971 [Gossypium barbadense]|nr:hypothetical protein GOBAR_DD27971 [Gossypium barbadense]
MDDKFFVCVYFDGIILTTTVGCIFECWQPIVMRFNRNVSLDDMKGMINAKIVRRCGRRISKIFYKFPVLTDPIKFTEMELVDDEDVETMIALYCGNRSDKNAPIHLFAELAEFPEYPEILPTHRQAVNSDHEELFVGQRFESKEECVFAIKRYSMNIIVDYKKVAEGCNWRVRAAFIQNCQMWKIRKFVGPHTCTSTRMKEYHLKLDSKTIYTCIMSMVKDMPTIKVLVLIVEMQARFPYRVSYRKAWIAKQMTMEQLYGDYDSSYNELQGWISTMREYVPGTVIELQTISYYGSDDQLQPGKRIFHRMF